MGGADSVAFGSAAPADGPRPDGGDAFNVELAQAKQQHAVADARFGAGSAEGGDPNVQQAQLLVPMPATPGAPPTFGGTPDEAAVDGLARSIQRGMGGAMQGAQSVIHDGVEQWQALEYRGRLRSNTLSLLGQSNPALKLGLNGPGQPRLEIHHTVPYADPGAKRARDVLAKWGASIHDPADAAILPDNYHRGENVHGMVGPNYDDWINTQMDEADRAATAAAEHGGRSAGRAAVLSYLRRASDTLVKDSGDQRAIALEGTLRALERPLPRPDLGGVYDWRGYAP